MYSEFYFSADSKLSECRETRREKSRGGWSREVRAAAWGAGGWTWLLKGSDPFDFKGFRKAKNYRPTSGRFVEKTNGCSLISSGLERSKILIIFFKIGTHQIIQNWNPDLPPPAPQVLPRMRIYILFTSDQVLLVC